MARSEAEKAETLALLQANGGNILKTARESGVPEATIRKWRDGEGISAEVAEKCEVKKAELADRLQEMAHLILDKLPEKLLTANLKDAATAFGIAVDKMRLLREMPTQITRDDGITPDERVERVAELLNAARTRGTGRAPESPGAVH